MGGGMAEGTVNGPARSGALLIEGRHMEIALAASGTSNRIKKMAVNETMCRWDILSSNADFLSLSLGNPPMRYIIRAIESLYKCKFVRKEWHQVCACGKDTKNVRRMDLLRWRELSFTCMK